MKPCLLVTWFAWSLVVMAAQHHPRDDVVLAPGYGDLEFTLPAPGSYDLPVLGRAADSKLMNSSGNELALHDLLGEKFTLLGFIYTRCPDINGCPLASYVMGQIQNRVMEDEILRAYVRLVSFSFDPMNDTPEVMEQYAKHFRKPGFDWHFVTARSQAELEETLQAYDQFVIRDYDQEGRLIGSMSHMLRVYLIDHNREIRNIYSVSFLHAETVINDIRTIIGDAVATKVSQH